MPGSRGIGLSWQAGWLLVVVGAAYANAFAGVYQFDDFRVLFEDPAVASLSAWWQSMPSFRPLLKLSYALNLALDEPARLFGLHALNIALHAGNAILLLLIFRALPGGTGVAPFLAALLFAAHPVHTEAVTYLSGRSMSLMAGFYLVSLLAHLHGRIALSLLAFGLALLTRETALTLPLALWMLDRLRLPGTRWRQALRPGRWHWWIAAAGVLYLLALPHFRHLAETSLATRPLLDNLVTQSGGVLYLAGQLLQPGALNADPQLPVFNGWNPAWVAKSLLILALLLGALRRFLPSASARTQPADWLAFGLLWFLLHLAPTNSLLPRLDVGNERHLYLAAPGLYLALAQLLTRQRVTRLFGFALVVALVLACQQRNAVYQSEIAFWRDVLRHDAQHPRALNNLGYAYARSGQPLAALEAYSRGLALEPGDFTLHFNRRALCRTHAQALAGHCPSLLPP